MSEPKVNVKDCSHIRYRISDSGMNVQTWSHRDIGLECEDCGTVWDIKLIHGQKRAYIKVRPPVKE